MFRLKESIHIDAPLDRCFLLSTSIPLVARTLAMTPIAGKLDGLILNGDRVLWSGRKFGLPQFHETLITRYERPNFFQDTMARGRFQHFQHDHNLQFIDGHTFAHDVIRFSLPFGPIGKLVAKRIVIPYILTLLKNRLHLLKRVAESNEWKTYLEEAPVTAQASHVRQASQPGGVS